MDELTKFLQLNIPNILIALFLIIEAIRYTSSSIEWIFKKLGLEFKWKRRQTEDHELLIDDNKRINSLEEKMDELIKLFQVMQDKADARSRARLKDRIAQAYRKYHETQEWTLMDKEAFEGLIKSYEDSGGDNSFVHETCQPESYTWKILDE